MSLNDYRGLDVPTAKLFLIPTGKLMVPAGSSWFLLVVPADHNYPEERNALIRDLIDFGVAKVEAMPKSACTEKDQIDNFLNERRLMRSLDKFVGGRLYEGDLRSILMDSKKKVKVPGSSSLKDS
ncbi:hypothetical protein Tco_0811715 [Tanacetum coccineum]